MREFPRLNKKPAFKLMHFMQLELQKYFKKTALELARVHAFAKPLKLSALVMF